MKVKSFLFACLAAFAAAFAVPASADQTSASLMMTGTADVVYGQGGVVGQAAVGAGTASPFAATQASVEGGMQALGGGLVVQLGVGVAGGAAAQSLPSGASASSSTQSVTSVGVLDGVVTSSVFGTSGAAAVWNW